MSDALYLPLGMDLLWPVLLEDGLSLASLQLATCAASHAQQTERARFPYFALTSEIEQSDDTVMTIEGRAQEGSSNGEVPIYLLPQSATAASHQQRCLCRHKWENMFGHNSFM